MQTNVHRMRAGNPRTYIHIIKAVIRHLESKGFTEIAANTDGFAQPDAIKWDEQHQGVIPDIIARVSGMTYIFEIDEGHTSVDEQTSDRWHLLAAHARRHEGKFYLVVPDKQAREMRKSLRKLDIEADILTIVGV